MSHAILVGSETLREKAERLYKDNEYLQTQWLNSIDYLRNKSKRGWILDVKVQKRGEKAEFGYA